MRFIDNLSQDEKMSLEHLLRSSTDYRVRQRSQAILLSAKGYTIKQLTNIFEVDRDTISHWFKHWEAEKRLKDLPRSGRVPIKAEKKMA